MMERTTYRGWQNAYKLWNDHVQVIVLADVGPRIIWYGFCDKENQLHEVPADAGLTGGTDFRLYGGHRLWVSQSYPAPTIRITTEWWLMRMAIELVSLLLRKAHTGQRPAKRNGNNIGAGNVRSHYPSSSHERGHSYRS